MPVSLHRAKYSKRLLSRLGRQNSVSFPIRPIWISKLRLSSRQAKSLAEAKTAALFSAKLRFRQASVVFRQSLVHPCIPLNSNMRQSSSSAKIAHVKSSANSFAEPSAKLSAKSTAKPSKTLFVGSTRRVQVPKNKRSKSCIPYASTSELKKIFIASLLACHIQKSKDIGWLYSHEVCTGSTQLSFATESPVNTNSEHAGSFCSINVDIRIADHRPVL